MKTGGVPAHHHTSELGEGWVNTGDVAEAQRLCVIPVLWNHWRRNEQFDPHSSQPLHCDEGGGGGAFRWLNTWLVRTKDTAFPLFFHPHALVLPLKSCLSNRDFNFSCKILKYIYFLQDFGKEHFYLLTLKKIPLALLKAATFAVIFRGRSKVPLMTSLRATFLSSTFCSQIFWKGGPFKWPEAKHLFGIICKLILFRFLIVMVDSQ